MVKKIIPYLQYALPQKTLTTLMGWLAESHNPRIKNQIIRWFIKRYGVDLSLAQIRELENYASFNDFFIRSLRSDLRPIDQDPSMIISPVDGTVSQVGQIAGGQLLQAKHFYFTLETLLGDPAKASPFQSGTFGTFYLAPKDYHRVHMPYDGHLTETVYIPGKLFSVNKMTSEIIPNLYSRNERLVLFFETIFGPMVLIFVGAMIVGNIQPAWTKKTPRSKKLKQQKFDPNLFFKKGDELGHFKLGSTVILLFPSRTIEWLPNIYTNQPLCFGQPLGKVIK